MIDVGQVRLNWIRESETQPKFANDTTASSIWLVLTDLERAKVALPDIGGWFSHLIFDKLVVHVR